MFSGRDRGSVRGIADRDPAAGRCLDIDGVDADPGPRDDPQVRCPIHERGAVLRRPDHRGDSGVDASVRIVLGRRAQERAGGRDRGGELGEHRSLEPDRRQLGGCHAGLVAGLPANRGSGSPLTPASMAKSPPASGCAGSISVGPTPADRGDEQRRQVGAAESRHRRLLDGDGDAPIDDAPGRDPEDRPAVHTRDPIAATLVDARAVGPAREGREVEVDPLSGGIAGRDVVVVRPDGVAMGIREVHRPPVRCEGQTVRHADAAPDRDRRAVRLDPVEQAGRRPGAVARGDGGVRHRPDPEPPGRVAAPVVEAIPQIHGFEDHPLGPGAGRPVEECQAALDGHEQAFRRVREGQRRGPTRCRSLLIQAGRWVEAMDRSPIDIHPVETGLGRTPRRAFAQLGTGGQNACRRSVIHAGMAHAPRPVRPRRNATLSTASAFGPLPSAGSSRRETSCSSTYQPR